MILIKVDDLTRSARTTPRAFEIHEGPSIGDDHMAARINYATLFVQHLKEGFAGWPWCIVLERVMGVAERIAWLKARFKNLKQMPKRGASVS
jgi:hypothetical protein